MDRDHLNGDSPARQPYTSEATGRYFSVQFTTRSMASYYQFKLWNIPSAGMCILVKEGSKVLKHIKVGDTITMTYYLANAQGLYENLKTRIRHITTNEDGRFRGHLMVGLAII